MPKKAFFLEGEKVVLAPVDMEDVDAYYAFINDQRNDCYTEHAQFPHTRASLVEYIKEKNAARDTLFLGIYQKRTRRHIGNIELSSINGIHHTAEFKILIDHASWGNGYGYEASLLLLAHGFDTLNLYKINLGVSADNKGAIRLYKKLGFHEEGRLKGQLLRDGKRVDVLLMGKVSKYQKSNGQKANH